LHVRSKHIYHRPCCTSSHKTEIQRGTPFCSFVLTRQGCCLYAEFCTATAQPSILPPDSKSWPFCKAQNQFHLSTTDLQKLQNARFSQTVVQSKKSSLHRCLEVRNTDEQYPFHHFIIGRFQSIRVVSVLIQLDDTINWCELLPCDILNTENVTKQECGVSPRAQSYILSL